MAVSENSGRTTIFTVVSYTLPRPDILLRRVEELVKDENAVDFVTIKDESSNVGEPDPFVNRLQNELDRLEADKAILTASLDSDIQFLQDQINEIEAL